MVMVLLAIAVIIRWRIMEGMLTIVVVVVVVMLNGRKTWGLFQSRWCCCSCSGGSGRILAKVARVDMAQVGGVRDVLRELLCHGDLW